MNKPRVWLRADASAQIGYGHFVRTLALGQMLGRDDFELVFATRYPSPSQIEQIEAACDRYVALGDDHFEAFLAPIEPHDIVVLDNYFFTTDYQRQIKDRGAKLVCVDDMHDKHYLADVVINHGLTDPSLFSVEPYTRLCLGLDWVLLRPPFFEQRAEPRHAGHCVVCFGGVDPYNLTGKVVEALSEQKQVTHLTAVVGEAYVYLDTLKAMERVEVVTKQSADQMAHLFRSASWAVVPASTVCLEAIACRCPVVGGYYVDNQQEGALALAAQGAIVSVGDWLEGSVAEKLNAVWGAIETPTFSLSDTPTRYRTLFEQL